MGEGMTGWQKLARWIAYRLPRRVLYFAVVRAWNETTTEPWPDTDPITASQMLSRLHVRLRDGKIQAQ